MGERKPRLPPRWFVVTAWHVHRRIVRASRGRRGLLPPRADKWGALRLTTKGRRSGRPRSVILGYYEDGPEAEGLKGSSDRQSRSRCMSGGLQGKSFGEPSSRPEPSADLTLHPPGASQRTQPAR
jgi:hypothetical protein